MKTQRIWEIDFLRGIAIVCMVIFHFLYDVEYYGILEIDLQRGIFFLIGRTAAVLFILLSGISCTFSSNNWKRGAKLLGIALLLTMVTYLFDANYFVKFGILHFLGISMMLASLLQNRSVHFLLILAYFIFAFALVFTAIRPSMDLFFPIGIFSERFASSDYYPLFPWFSLYLIGMTLGKLIYPDKKALLRTPRFLEPLSFLGRHSLVIYLIHQPILIAFIVLILLEGIR